MNKQVNNAKTQHSVKKNDCCNNLNINTCPVMA